MGTSLYRQFPWTQRCPQASYNQPFFYDTYPLLSMVMADTLVSSFVLVKEVWALFVWVRRDLNNWGSSIVTTAVEGSAAEINKKSQHKLQVQYWSLSHRELTWGGSCLILELRKVAHRETAPSKKEAKDITTPSHWDLCTLMTISHKKKPGLVCTCITVTLLFC